MPKNLSEADVTDYVAILGQRDVVIAETRVKRVTATQVVTAGDHRYWKADGRRVNEHSRGHSLQVSTRERHDAWIKRTQREAKRLERQAERHKADHNREENQLIRALASMLEFQREALLELPIIRLRVAYRLLNTPPDTDVDLMISSALTEPVEFPPV